MSEEMVIRSVIMLAVVAFDVICFICAVRQSRKNRENEKIPDSLSDAMDAATFDEIRISFEKIRKLDMQSFIVLGKAAEKSREALLSFNEAYTAAKKLADESTLSFNEAFGFTAGNALKNMETDPHASVRTGSE